MASKLRNSPNWVICDHLLAELCLQLRTALNQAWDNRNSDPRVNAGRSLVLSTRKLLEVARKKEHRDGRKRSRRYLVLFAVLDAFYTKRGWKLAGLLNSKAEAAVQHSTWSKYIHQQRVSEFCSDERADSINEELCELVLERTYEGLHKLDAAILCLRESCTRVSESYVSNLYYPGYLSTLMSEAPKPTADSGMASGSESYQSSLTNTTSKDCHTGLSAMPIELVCQIAGFMASDTFFNFRAIDRRTRDMVEQKFFHRYFRARRIPVSMKSILTLWEISLDLCLSLQVRILVIHAADIDLEPIGDLIIPASHSHASYTTYVTWSYVLERAIHYFTQLRSCYATDKPMGIRRLEGRVWDPAFSEHFSRYSVWSLFIALLAAITQAKALEHFHFHVRGLADCLDSAASVRAWHRPTEKAVKLHVVKHFDLEVQPLSELYNGWKNIHDIWHTIWRWMPNLESLTMVPDKRYGQRGEVALLDWIVCNQDETLRPLGHSPLRQLTIKDMFCKASTLCRLGQRFPWLEAVSLRRCVVTFTTQDDWSESWPRLLRVLARLCLRRLDIVGCMGCDESLESLQPTHRLCVPKLPMRGETTDRLLMRGACLSEHLASLALEATVEVLAVPSEESDEAAGSDEAGYFDDLDESDDSDV